MAKVIWHLGGVTNFNHGDCVLQSSIAKIIRERCKEDVRFVHVDTQKTFFSKHLIDKMNKEADLLLIGGGGFIFHRPSDNSHSGWQFNIKKENISDINIPIAVYGIGNNKFPYDHSVFPLYMWESVQAIIDKSVVFSVRNDGTRRSMKDAGVCVDYVDVVPDAAVFADSFTFSHPCLDTDKFKIGLNYATDRWPSRFSDEVSARETLDSVLEACKDSVQKYNAKIYLIEHLSDNEMNKVTKPFIRSRAKNILGDDVCILFDEMGEELYPPFGYMSGLFVDIYKQMDIMIGMRGHANIIPFGQNTPCIGIGEHDKVKWFLEEVDLTRSYVPLDYDLQTNKDELSDTINRVVTDIDTYKSNMTIKKNQLTVIKDDFVDRIVDAL
jgi:polysaccharide pyruvyl transferase WcaK-like protein